MKLAALKAFTQASYRNMKSYFTSKLTEHDTLRAVVSPTPNERETGCLPFVRVNRLGRALNNGKGFSKIAKPTERNGAYHLQFDFPSLFSADERLETDKFCKW